MICPQCQTPNDDSVAFCTRCGTGLAPAAAPAGYYQPQQAGQAPQPGGYAPTQGGYTPPPSGYAPQQGGYAPPQGGYAPTQGGYAPQQGGYAPPQPGPIPAAPSAVPAFQFDLRRLTTFDRIVGVTAFITMISIWLPWFTWAGFGGTVSVSGTDYHGFLWLEFILALAVLVYLAARAGWERLPGGVTIQHDLALRVATGVQLLLIVIAFFDTPQGFGWDFGSILALLAALVPVGFFAVPAIRSFLASRSASQP